MADTHPLTSTSDRTTGPGDLATVFGQEDQVMLKWEPTRIEAIGAVTGTLGNIFRFASCDYLTINGLTIDYDPSPLTQGQVTAVQFDTVGGVPPHFRFRPDTGFGFAWRTCDYFGSYDPATGQFQNVNFEDAFSDEEGGQYTITDYLVNGVPTGEFVFTPPAQAGVPGSIPEWMAAGQRLWIAVRKRLSSPFTFIRGRNLDATVTLRAAAGAGIVGNGLIDPTINYLCQGRGIIAGAADGVLMLDVRGTYTSQTHVSFGQGDDSFNVRTKLWDDFIESFVPGVPTSVIQLTCRNPLSLLPVAAPEVPLRGDLVEFWDNTGKLIDRNRVDTVDQSTFGTQPTRLFLVKFQNPLLSDYDPRPDAPNRWMTLNRAAVATLDLGLLKIVGGIRGLFASSHDWSVGELHVENLLGSGLRHTFPATGAHAGIGGAKGGGRIRLMTVRNAGYNKGAYTSAVINVQLNGSNGSTPYAGPIQSFPPVEIDRLNLDGCGYGVSFVSGFRLEIGERQLRNVGQRRSISNVVPSDSDYYDDYVRYSSLTVAADGYNPVYRSSAGINGQITVTPDPVALRIGTYDHDGDSTLVAYPRRTPSNIVISAAFSASRTIVLSAQDAQRGDRYVIDHLGNGPGSAIIRQKSLSTLPTLIELSPSKWAAFLFDGVNWRLEGTGSIPP